MIRRDDALLYHGGPRPGLIDVRPAKPCLTARDMRLAYLPGATFACQAIARDPADAARLTGRGNLVAVITNGTAVPGLGDVGALAAKPVQEGIALLFKRLGDIDVFDLELDARDPERFVDVAHALAPGFAGIVLSNLAAPAGLAIHDRLCQSLRIPVFHENLQSTAVVMAASLWNAVDLAGKTLDAVQVVMCGAGTVGLGCARLALGLGIRPEHLLLYDVNGLLHPDRTDLTPYQRALARVHPARTLDEALRGADVFIGASVGHVVTEEMVRSMARFPIVFALATPDPEITYETARAARRDVIAATAVATSPNAILDLLSFPYIMRGALDVQATRISDGMLLAAARALADLAREEVIDEVSRAYASEPLSFGPEYLLPKPIDPRILVRESAAVARRAIEEGVAQRVLAIEPYQESLRVRLGTGRETLRRLMVKARRERPRVVFPEGCNPTILRACSILADEGVARPILLGREPDVRAAMARLGLDAAGVGIVDPARSLRRETYVDEYFRLRQRHGVMRATAAERLAQPDYFAAMMLHSGDADLMISGVASHYADSIRVILEVVGVAPGVRRISSHYLALLPRHLYFLADCAVNIEPDAAALAEIAMLTAGRARALGVEPHVAMLSFSNFGSVDHPFARKVRCATDIVKGQAPELNVDGEMQLATAVERDVRAEYFPFSDLDTDANVLVFPDLQSGNLAMHLLRHIGDAVVIGPVLMGTRLPAHLIQYGSTADDVVNLAVVGIVEAAGLRENAPGGAAPDPRPAP
jgi:malate dehydrogenase (oxaloacetate-decarboxylating)(NADP+)